MSVFYRCVATAGLGLGLAVAHGAAYAASSSGLALAKAKQCLGCHQVDARRVGPPFTAIAQRFGGQPGASDYLARVIREGSSGQWGAIPMPAQSRLSAFDAQQLAQWILSLPVPKD